MNREEHYRYQAIDRCFSSYVFSVRDRRAVWHKIQTTYSFRRKIRFSLAIAIILMLVMSTVSAIGYLWRNRVEAAAKMYKKYGSELEWSPAQYEEAMDTFEVLDVDMSDRPDMSDMDEETALETARAYFDSKFTGETDDLFENLVEQEGPWNRWSLEDKAWYSELCAQYGFHYPYDMICSLPNADEFSQEQAVMIAKEKIVTRFDIDKAELERYLITIAYFAYQNAPNMKYWRIQFLNTSPIDAVEDGEIAYSVVFAADGSDIEDGYYKGIRAMDKKEKEDYIERWNNRAIEYLDLENPSVQWTPEYIEKFNGYARKYGAYLNWPMDIKAEMWDDDIPSQDIIPPDEALRIAKAYMEESGISHTSLYPNVRYREEYGYLIWFYPDEYGNESFQYFTTVNPVTKECEGILEK